MNSFVHSTWSLTKTAVIIFTLYFLSFILYPFIPSLWTLLNLSLSLVSPTSHFPFLVLRCPFGSLPIHCFLLPLFLHHIFPFLPLPNCLTPLLLKLSRIIFSFFFSTLLFSYHFCNIILYVYASCSVLPTRKYNPQRYFNILKPILRFNLTPSDNFKDIGWYHYTSC